MKDFLERNYGSFISGIKKYICNTVKMGKYNQFLLNLDIQLLAEPIVKKRKNKNTGIDDSKPLTDGVKPAQIYLVTEKRVELGDYKIDLSAIKKKRSEVTGLNDISGPFDYKVTWFVDGAKKFGFVEKNIVRTLLEILKDKVDRFESFAKDFPGTLLRDVCFMEKYYKIIKDYYKLPDEKLLSKISHKTYENRENKGIMCFVPRERNRLSEQIEFSEKSIDEAGFVDSNIDNMRKLLEISKPGFEGDKNKCLLFDPENRQCWGLVLEEKINRKNYLLVYFLGPGRWEIRYKGEVVFKCNNDEFSFNKDSRKEALEEKLSKAVKDREKQQLFIKLIQCLEKQRHGALVIIASDAEKETDRLCNLFKRGTKITEKSLEDEDALSVISGFCSVDGAIFMDLEGHCHGYGVILDGKAKIPGNRGRGARYNSASNYIAKSNKYAIVVSEDKDKDIEILEP